MTVPFPSSSPSSFPLDAGSIPPKYFADAGGPKQEYEAAIDERIIEDLGRVEEDSELPPWAFRARSIVNDVRSHPMDDDQAVALAQVYALLAIEEALGRLIR